MQHGHGMIVFKELGDEQAADEPGSTDNQTIHAGISGR
jgi:hypothetical protein